MHLSHFSDYSLRVLMYLAALPDRLATIAEIAAAHGISEAHLMKVVHHLGCAGYVETVRGKGGGMRLGRRPEKIVIGEVIRSTENALDLAKCTAEPAVCRIYAACRLRGILDEAMQGLFLVLDSYTVADLLSAPEQR